MGSDGLRHRVDRELVRRGLVASREEAQRVIELRRVQVDGAPVAKPSTLVRRDQRLILGGPPPRFVSRGGEKLQGALERFEVDPTGLRVLDAGISTGGFSDCLLQAGAASIIGVDVGYGQLAERLRRDERVDLRERTNVRALTLDALGGVRVDLLVADLSFISLTTVLPVLLPLVRDDGSAILLVKPQFEVGRARVGRGGIVRDPSAWADALTAVADAAAEASRPVVDVMPSPIRGAEGNVEFLVRIGPGGSGTPGGELAARIEAAITEVTTDPVSVATSTPVPEAGEASRDATEVLAL